MAEKIDIKMNTIAGVLRFENEMEELFSRNYSLLSDYSSDLMNSRRKEAFQRFLQSGLPKKKAENYKYLDVPSVFNRDFKKLLSPKQINFEVDDIFRCDIPSLDTHLILLLNGYYYSKQEELKVLPNGIIMGSIRAASKRYPELVKKYYAKDPDFNSESLVALNTAFVQDGMFIYVPRNVQAELPVQVINMQMSDEALFVQHRNLVILEENSQIHTVVCDHTLSSQSFLTNGVTEIFAGPGSSLNYTKIQNEHNDSSLFNHRFVYQAAGSRVNSTVITLHGGLVRNNLYVKLDGEGCDNTSSGLFLTDQKQHVDNFTWIEHAKPHCTSNQLYKGVLDDASTAAFNGRIIVQKGAQKTNAYQKNNNLLLTNEAKMNTKPQLEIYADDVKCSHGATIGQLDREALFYLRSRGIGEEEARLLMMYAFTDEVIQNIGVEVLRNRIADLVNKRLRRELSRCHNCAMHCC